MSGFQDTQRNKNPELVHETRDEDEDEAKIDHDGDDETMGRSHIFDRSSANILGKKPHDSADDDSGSDSESTLVGDERRTDVNVESDQANSTSTIQHIYDIVPTRPALLPSAQSKADDGCRTKLRLIRARMLLMHCGVLQNLMCDTGIDYRVKCRGKSERQWGSEREKRKYQVYGKMQDLAETAKELARKENNQGLNVRSEYWLGRSCGGNQDYEAAIEHLEIVEDLESRADLSRPEIALQRGELLRTEKADFNDLILHCRERLKDLADREERIQNRAKKESEKRGISVEVALGQTRALRPLEFDHERNKKLVAKMLGSQLGSDPPAARTVTFADAQQDAQRYARQDPQQLAAYGSPGKVKTTTITFGATKNYTPRKRNNSIYSKNAPTGPRKRSDSAKSRQHSTSTQSSGPSTLSRRNTRGSVRSVMTMGSDLSCPWRENLEDELGELGEGWYDYESGDDLSDFAEEVNSTI